MVRNVLDTLCFARTALGSLTSRWTLHWAEKMCAFCVTITILLITIWKSRYWTREGIRYGWLAPRHFSFLFENWKTRGNDGKDLTIFPLREDRVSSRMVWRPWHVVKDLRENASILCPLHHHHHHPCRTSRWCIRPHVNSFHLARSFATHPTSFHEPRPSLLLSSSAVLRQVVLDLSLLLLPSGAHVKDTFALFLSCYYSSSAYPWSFLTQVASYLSCITHGSRSSLANKFWTFVSYILSETCPTGKHLSVSSSKLRRHIKERQEHYS